MLTLQRNHHCNPKVGLHIKKVHFQLRHYFQMHIRQHRQYDSTTSYISVLAVLQMAQNKWANEKMHI